MPQYVPSIIIDNVIDALKAFLQPFVGTAQIVRGQDNRVPQPLDGDVVLTELLQSDLETPVITDDPTNSQVAVAGPARIDIQIDFYGPSSGDWSKAVKGVFRTYYATAQFPDGIKPLYCSDGIQSPLISGEQQYESRWTLTASLQYNAVVELPQQYANVATVAETIAADLL